MPSKTTTAYLLDIRYHIALASEWLSGSTRRPIETICKSTLP
jgi:hypothetical protein